MFEFFLKYPRSVYARGQFSLLGAWPKWMLVVLILAAAAGLAWLIRSRLAQAAPVMRGWRVWVVWGLQTLLAGILLVLLWQPAITVAELKPQQNVIAVLVDDSRSMAISEDGSTRQAQAVKALQDGVLSELQKKYQTRLYRLDSHPTHISSLNELHALSPATRIGDSLKQLAAETTDLPIGAIVLLSDGADNSGGIDLDKISALRHRRIPVHTVGFGLERLPHDVEINEVALAARALADSRLAARVSFHQSGYAGMKSTLAVRDGAKVLASREITFTGEGRIQTETIPFNAGSAGAKALEFSIDPLPGEQNRSNNAVTRLVNVVSDKRRVLYVEGEPLWEYTFI